MCMLICMHMLTKRTNILFDEELWRILVQLAKLNNTSVGKLIRDAVADKYTKKATFLKRQTAIESTLKKRLMSKDRIDYKELINYGRKY